MRAATTEQRLRVSLAHRVHGLYAITPEMPDTRLLVELVVAAVRGGASAVQYRSKHADRALRRAQATALRHAVQPRSALLIVNDDVELAREVDADGVHLGEDDASIGEARTVLGQRVIGISCYDDLDRARALAREGADYVAFGSFFPSAVKPNARRAGLSLLARARDLDVPLVAIGGIDAGNARALFAAGANAVAVISAVFGTRDPAEVERAAREIASLAAVS